MSVRKRTRFLSPNRISEMVWYNEIEEAGASNDCVNYLCNGILCTFRQPLNYLCYSFSFLDEIRKYYVETLDCSSWKIYWKWWRKLVDSTALKKIRSVSVRDSDAAKMSRVNCDWCEEKKLLEQLWESTVCVWCKMWFLKLPGKGKTPHSFAMKFHLHTSRPKENC